MRQWSVSYFQLRFINKFNDQGCYRSYSLIRMPQQFKSEKRSKNIGLGYNRNAEIIHLSNLHHFPDLKIYFGNTPSTRDFSSDALLPIALKNFAIEHSYKIYIFT